jgi:5-(carboxyamino)imidazole ribonucleotide mutase
MPPGVPVATVGINASKNAALLALQILGTFDNEISEKMNKYKADLKSSIEIKNQKISELGYKKYLEEKSK